MAELESFMLVDIYSKGVYISETDRLYEKAKILASKR